MEVINELPDYLASKNGSLIRRYLLIITAAFKIDKEYITDKEKRIHG